MLDARDFSLNVGFFNYWELFWTYRFLNVKGSTIRVTNKTIFRDDFPCYIIHASCFPYFLFDQYLFSQSLRVSTLELKELILFVERCIA